MWDYSQRIQTIDVDEKKMPYYHYTDDLLKLSPEQLDEIQARREKYAKIKKPSDKQKIDEILARIEYEGLSMERACSGVMATSWFKTQRKRHKDVEARYTCACEERKRLLLESTLFIAADNTGDLSHVKASKDANGKLVVELKENREFSSRSKLKIETIFKYLQLVDPDKYSGKAGESLSEDDKVNIVVNFNRKKKSE